MNRFDAVVFDMDGVIVDSEPLHERAFRELFAELGFPGDTHGLDFAAYYGRSDEAVWRDFITRHHPPQSMDELLSRKRERFLSLLHAGHLFEGLPALLERLSRCYPLAVASGSAHAIIDGVLALEGLRRFFRAVVSASDVGREKPDPSIFLRAAELLRVKPNRCCVVEDSAAGVQGARNASMTVIGITNSLPASKLRGADFVVQSYSEVESILLSDAPTLS